MKYMRKIAAVVLVISLVALICACTPSKKVQNEVYDYLNSKYKGLEFELLDYKQEKETSGRYTVFAKCLTTNVDFQIYVSSMFTTDSYSVSYANSVMDPQLMDTLGTAREAACVSEIQWLDLYEEESDGYKFRDVSADISYNVKDVNEIYRIKLSGVESANDAAQCVYMAVTTFDMQGIELDTVTFEFTLNDTPILFTTDTVSVKEIPLEDLEAKFYAAESSSEKESNILFKSTPYKEISYFQSGSSNIEKDQ